MAIYLTGASGYLGQHIMRLDPSVIPVDRNRPEVVSDQVVIHAAWPTPKTEDDAHDVAMQSAGLRYTEELVGYDPRFVVFVSTRTGTGTYPTVKNLAASTIPRHLRRVVRFPGLYGPPRNGGLMYNMYRMVLLGASFQACHPLPGWTAMHVEDAAALCLKLAREECPGVSDARDQRFEDWLRFCRE